MTCGLEEPDGIRLVEARAIVIATTPGLVVVETQRLSACSGCGVAGQCSTAALHRLIGRPDDRLELASTREFDIGQSVTLTIPEAGLLLAAALTYLLPLAGLIVAALLAAVIDGSETATLPAAGLGLAAGVLVARKLTKAPGFVAKLVPIRLKS